MTRHLVAILFIFITAFTFTLNAATPICGDLEVSVDRMYEFVRTHNKSFPREIAEAYYNIGKKYGVRGDIALCQAILETGWFRFADDTAVTSDQYNFCGLGVTVNKERGHAFESIEEGVTAQIQHLYAYGSRDELPAGETIIDPRFSYVSRGSASTWEDLNGRWAANKHYSDRILSLYYRMAQRTIEIIEVDIPDEYWESHE